MKTKPQSLKQKLNNLIQSRNGAIVTINEIEELCKQEHYKMSNAERRLRHSESPMIEPVKKGNAIIGYKWKTKMDGCCSDMIIFGEHFKPCQSTETQKQLSI